MQSSYKLLREERRSLTSAPARLILLLSQQNCSQWDFSLKATLQCEGFPQQLPLHLGPAECGHLQCHRERWRLWDVPQRVPVSHAAAYLLLCSACIPTPGDGSLPGLSSVHSRSQRFLHLVRLATRVGSV